MKTRIFLTLLGGAIVVAPILAPRAVAQDQDGYKKTWKGVATLRTLRKKSKNQDLLAVYPVFSGARRVAQVAGLVLKQRTIRDFNAFEKESRTPTGIGLPYELNITPSLILNRPRFISAWVSEYQFEGGAHGNYDIGGYNFGYPSGAAKPRELHLADFFSDGNAASKRINDLLMAKLRATKGKDHEASFVLDGTVKWVDVGLRENFVAEADGLRWNFPPYSMGPFSNGDYEVKLTASELGPQFRAAMLR